MAREQEEIPRECGLFHLDDIEGFGKKTAHKFGFK